MTATREPDLPEGFEAWPRKVQKHYLQELHALYFPVLHWFELAVYYAGLARP